MSYTYLANGQRRTKTVGSNTTTYRYNNGLLLSQTTGTGTTAETLSFTYDADGKPVSITYKQGSNTAVTYFYAYNGQGDVIAIYNSSNSTLVGSYEYDLWGKLISVTPASSSSDPKGILTKNPFRYRGYYYDTETGYYYLNARYYDPQVRRFISADDMAYLGADGTIIGYNLFAYCANNSVTRVDSNGHFSWRTVFYAALGVTAVALLVVAVVASGGAAGALIVATTGSIVGTTVTTAAVTTVAMDVAIAGGVTATAAGVGTIIEESRYHNERSIKKQISKHGQKQSKNYRQAKNNKTANNWAKKFGYDNAEQLKNYYSFNKGSNFNMFRDNDTNELILIGIRDGAEIFTKLFFDQD